MLALWLSRVLAQLLTTGGVGPVVESGVGPNIKIKIHGKVIIGSACMVPVLFWACISYIGISTCDLVLIINIVVNACWMLMWICAICCNYKLLEAICCCALM